MMTQQNPIVELLRQYQPRGEAESADVARVLRLAEGTEDLWSQDIPLHVTASAVVVHPPTGTMLLRWHSRQQAWLQIGGHGDPGEHEPIDVALREGREETGLADLVPWPDASLVHVVICSVPAKGDSPAHEHADLRFVLATEDPSSARPERADAPLKWATFAGATDFISEANLRETITRVQSLTP